MCSITKKKGKTKKNTDGNATEWTPMGMHYYMPWTPQKNDTIDEVDENGEDWLLTHYYTIEK